MKNYYHSIHSRVSRLCVFHLYFQNAHISLLFCVLLNYLFTVDLPALIYIGTDRKKSFNLPILIKVSTIETAIKLTRTIHKYHFSIMIDLNVIVTHFVWTEYNNEMIYVQLGINNYTNSQIYICLLVLKQYRILYKYVFVDYYLLITML